MTDIGKLATEQRNAASEHIDRLPTLDMVRLINNEDKNVAGAVETVCPQIAEAIDGIYARMQRGGRLIYTGCGTSRPSRRARRRRMPPDVLDRPGACPRGDRGRVRRDVRRCRGRGG